MIFILNPLLEKFGKWFISSKDFILVVQDSELCHEDTCGTWCSSMCATSGPCQQANDVFVWSMIFWLDLMEDPLHMKDLRGAETHPPHVPMMLLLASSYERKTSINSVHTRVVFQGNK